MKTAQKICLALSLSLALSGAVQADSGHHGRHHGHRHHSHLSGGDVALLTIAGVAIGATAYRYYAPPPVYVPPRVVYAPPYAPPVAAGTWYFCNSSGQYYPYVRHCPEGWQALPAPPQ